MSGGILLGIGISSKKGLTLRKQLMDKGDEYQRKIHDKLTLISSEPSQPSKEEGKETKA